MKDIAVVGYCRTGIARAGRGALNQTHGIPMLAHVFRHALERAGVEAREVEDVVVGCGLPEGATGQTHDREVTLDRDEGPRPDTTFEGLSKLKPVYPGGTTTAGNASQLSDGAGAVVMMEAGEASRRNLPILGLFRGMQLAAVAPEEMSIAIPKPSSKPLGTSRTSTGARSPSGILMVYPGFDISARRCSSSAAGAPTVPSSECARRGGWRRRRISSGGDFARLDPEGLGSGRIRKP